MAPNLVPLVDLNKLSQSDLSALAVATNAAFAPGLFDDSDILPPPKIDRAVFNESAGSRKQTFSRHRPSPHPTSASAAPPTAADVDSENHLIVSHLCELLARDDPSFQAPPPPPPKTLALVAPPASQTLALSAPPPPPAPDPDRETANPNGVAVDLVRLAGLVDPYGEEIRRRTAGLGLDSELLGFMSGLDGQWGSRRRRRKFVDAAMFGDHLPRGWKLLLGLKRKERVAWVNCRRYVSPKGRQFASCKEVSSYLMSILGYPEAKTVTIQCNSTGPLDLSADDAVGIQQQIVSTTEKENVLPVTSVTLSGQTCESKKQEPLHKDESHIDAVNAHECQKCNLTFHDQSAYLQHQLSFHQRSAKRRRNGKSGALVLDKDGNFECQVCHKTFEQRSQYFGHVGAHARYQGLDPEALLDETSSKKVVIQSLAAVSCGLQEMSNSHEQEYEISAEKPGPEHHNDSNNNLHGLQLYDGACCSSEVVVAVKPVSKLNEIDCPNNHEGGGSEVELFSTNCSDNLNIPGEVFHGSKDVPPILDAPSERKCANNLMDCADLTESEQVLQSNDVMDDNIGFAEVTDFKDQAVSRTPSASLEDPDLKSVDMEVVDDSNITFKYDVVKPTSFENGNSDEDQITNCRMAALKHDEINNTMKTRVVNLNSCLISSPVETTNNEKSAVFNEANQPSIAEKCFGVNFNNDEGTCTIPSPVSGANNETSNALIEANESSISVKCFGVSFDNDNDACKGGVYDNQNDAMVYQPNLTMEPISATPNDVDYFASHSVTSQIENNGEEREFNVKEQMFNMQNTTNNEAGFDAVAYNNDIFTGTITDSSLAQMNNTISDLKADFSSCYSLSELNTLTVGNSTNEIDVNCMRSSFVNGSISNNEPNEHCTIDFRIKGSMLDAMEKSDNELENHYNGGVHGGDPLAAASTSGNIDDLMSMQVNYGSLSSLVRSVGDVPMGSMTQDQCDLQLGFGGQKQQIFPGYGELRSAAAGPSQFGSMPRHNSAPVSEPALMLGYAPQLGSGPPVQLGWDLSLSRMVTGGVLASVCVWCNNQFHHFGTVTEQQADSVGFICPACKEKISGHLSMLNNGSSL